MEAVMTSRAPFSIAVAAFVTPVLVMMSSPTLDGQEGQGARGKAVLLRPADAKEQAPATFRANFDTSAGSFVVEVQREWAPNGADRFYTLVKQGYFDGNRFYRVISGGFMAMAQFGINGDPAISKAWVGEYIPDDPVRAPRVSAEGNIITRAASAPSNVKGNLTFTSPGLNRRSIHVIIHLADNSTLDSSLVPFGRVVSGLDVVERLYSAYGDGAPTGKGPMLTPIYQQGNAYLEKEFPKLDYIKIATIVP
jgi:peptidyl-prolyl cis-trans isomerase A (cyclophilin A)